MYTINSTVLNYTIYYTVNGYFYIKSMMNYKMLVVS